MTVARLLTISLFFSFICVSCNVKTDRHKENLDHEHRREPYFQIVFNPDLPGCGNCHSNGEEPEKTFAAKANERWKDHNFDIKGKVMTVNDCLHCHSAVSQGFEGVIAPTPLREIVHRAHLTSPHFEGNCFTCHIIMGDSSSDLYKYSD